MQPRQAFAWTQACLVWIAYEPDIIHLIGGGSHGALVPSIEIRPHRAAGALWLITRRGPFRSLPSQFSNLDTKFVCRATAVINPDSKYKARSRSPAYNPHPLHLYVEEKRQRDV